jgi:SAM-dependent methyltransferase
MEASSADWVISNCVVNLSPEKHAVFREISRVLRPGGQMLISDIVVSDVPAWARTVVRWFNPAVAATIGEGEYVEGLRRAGLSDVEVRGRHVYERASIEGMLGSELDALVDRRFRGARARAVARRGLALLASRIASVAAGKVTSIQVHARKPSTHAAS